MTDTESEGRKTIEIWLRENVFSVTLDRVESVWRDLRFRSPFMTIECRPWSRDRSAQEAAKYVARRLRYLAQPPGSVSVKMQPIVLPRLSDGYRVTAEIFESDNHMIRESLYGHLENGQVLQGKTRTNIAGPEYSSKLALLVSVFGEATSHAPQHAPPAASDWYKFGEFWLPIPEEFTLPDTVKISFKPSEPFLQEELSLSILENFDVGILEDEPDWVKHFRREYDEASAVRRRDHGKIRISWGVGYIESFLLTPPLLPGDPDGEISEDFELYTRCVGVDVAGRAFCALLRSTFPRHADSPGLIDQHKGQAISLFETATFISHPQLHF